MILNIRLYTLSVVFKSSDDEYINNGSWKSLQFGPGMVPYGIAKPNVLPVAQSTVSKHQRVQ